MGLDSDEFQRQREKIDEYTQTMAEYLEERHPDPATEDEVKSHLQGSVDGRASTVHVDQAMENLEEREDVESLKPIGGNPPTPGFKQYRYREES